MTKSKFRTSKKDGEVRIVLGVKEYEKLMDDLEELDSIRAYDAAKKSGDAAIPFERATDDHQF
ncbi:MAG: hypothetical protein ACRD50_15520 [Candidatus Acidiferrales bacterium]